MSKYSTEFYLSMDVSGLTVQGVEFNPVPKAWEDKRVMKAFLSIAKRFICSCQSLEDCPHFTLRQLLRMYPCLVGKYVKRTEGATAVLKLIS